MTAHFNNTNDTSNSRHATHVAGTMISAGLDDSTDSRGPASKGMAPKATLHEFNVIDDFANIVSAKDIQLKSLGVVADNNSWDFTLGWSFESPNWVWNGDFFGAYDATYSSPYDAVAVKAGSALFVHANGNDGSSGNPSLPGLSQHLRGEVAQLQVVHRVLHAVGECYEVALRSAPVIFSVALPPPECIAHIDRHAPVVIVART